MSDISGISGTGADLDTQRRTIADNFDTFLSLLTAQLRNQDPLSPVDSNQFTAQLTQMAELPFLGVGIIKELWV